jgi:hypothetical protein
MMFDGLFIIYLNPLFYSLNPTETPNPVFL